MKLLASQFGGSSLQATMTTCYYLLPNLSRFNLSSLAISDSPVPWGTLALTAMYGVLYASAVLAMAIAIFQRRDFR